MKDERALCLRPLGKGDGPLIEAGIRDLSDRSRYLRFFSGFKQAPPSVLKLLTNFHDDHLAWGAVDSSLASKPAIAAAHIIQAEGRTQSIGDFSIAVLDAYHHQGIARDLMYCIFSEAKAQALTHIEFDVLRENKPALDLFYWMGAEQLHSDGPVIHMKLGLMKALSTLRPKISFDPGIYF